MNLKNKIINKDVLNIPNSLSFIRLLLFIPFYITLSQINSWPVARYLVIGLIFLAFITDILDGYFARKLDLISEFGKIIDPLADKILVILIITMLYIQNEIPGIYFWVIVLRDIIIFSGGLFLSKKIDKVLPSNRLGKITVLSIGFFILATLFGLEPSYFIYRFLFYISIILSFASLVAYAIRAYEIIKWKKEEHV